jgi:hypothetical protein
MDEKRGMEKAESVCNALIGTLMRRGGSKDVGLSERIMSKWVSEKAI